MIDKTNFCQKIRDIYLDIGECGIDLDVAFDETNQRWVVDLKKDYRRYALTDCGISPQRSFMPAVTFC